MFDCSMMASNYMSSYEVTNYKELNSSAIDTSCSLPFNRVFSSIAAVSVR